MRQATRERRHCAHVCRAERDARMPSRRVAGPGGGWGRDARMRAGTRPTCAVSTVRHVRVGDAGPAHGSWPGSPARPRPVCAPASRQQARPAVGPVRGSAAEAAATWRPAAGLLLVVSVSLDCPAASLPCRDSGLPRLLARDRPATARGRLRQGVHLVVATPGRLNDLLQCRAVKLNAVAVVVLDEAVRAQRAGPRDRAGWSVLRPAAGTGPVASLRPVAPPRDS